MHDPMNMKDVERVVRTSGYSFYEVEGNRVFPYYDHSGAVSSSVAVILFRPGKHPEGLEEGAVFAEGLQKWQFGSTYMVRVSVLCGASEADFAQKLKEANEELQACQ